MPIARQAARTLPSSAAMAKVRRRTRYSRSSCVTATRPFSSTWSSRRRMRRRSAQLGDVPRCRYISGTGHPSGTEGPVDLRPCRYSERDYTNGRDGVARSSPMLWPAGRPGLRSRRLERPWSAMGVRDWRPEFPRAGLGPVHAGSSRRSTTTRACFSARERACVASRQGGGRSAGHRERPRRGLAAPAALGLEGVLPSRVMGASKAARDRERGRNLAAGGGLGGC